MMLESRPAMHEYIDKVDEAIDSAIEGIYKTKLTAAKRLEVGLPGKCGGSGLSDLRSAVQASYISTIIAMVPTACAAVRG